MTLGPAYGGDGGAGFQLFTQTADNMSAIYTGVDLTAAEAARDAYFGANPGDLATLDGNESLIIKLVITGPDPDTVIYQQRQGGGWVDVTSLVQGETGAPGATGNSYFFESIAARDAFFNTPPNSTLLVTGLPVVVNESSVSTLYYWIGGNNPPSYDADLFRPASLGSSPGSLFLGKDGTNLSSAGRTVNTTDAFGDSAIPIGVRFDTPGSPKPVALKFSTFVSAIQASVFDTQLSDPETMLFTIGPNDAYVQDYTIRAATIGSLRVQAFAGTLETDPTLVDTTIAITAPDLGTTKLIPLDNQILGLAGDQILVKFSGVDLFGGVQTDGEFIGQTVPFLSATFSTLTRDTLALIRKGGGLDFEDGSTQVQAATAECFGWHVDTAIYKESLDIFAVSGNATGVFFRNNGTKAFISDNSATRIAEFDLSVSWELSTATFSTAFVVTSEFDDITGVFFRNDGLKMYVVGTEDIVAKVSEYDLGTAWDVSTSVFLQEFSVTPQDTDPREVVFSPTGQQMFIVGNNLKIIAEYALDIPWDVTTASFTLQTLIGAQDNEPTGLTFKQDGKVMYLCGDFTDTIYEYVLTTPWSVLDVESMSSFDISEFSTSPKGLYIRPDGKSIFVVDNGLDDIIQFDLGLRVDGVMSAERHDGNFLVNESIEFSDGSTQIEAATSSKFTHHIVTAVESTSLDLQAASIGPAGLFFRADGKKMYLIGTTPDQVIEYNLTEQWDIISQEIQGTFSVVTQATEPRGLFFRSDGAKMFLVDNFMDVVYSYTLTTPWDITSSVVTTETLAINSQDTSPLDLFFHPDGRHLYVLGTANDRVYDYVLSIPWDISTASYTGIFFSVAVPVFTPTGMSFKEDGTLLQVANSEGEIFEFILTTPWNISTAEFDHELNTSMTGAVGLFVRNDGGLAFSIDDSEVRLKTFGLGLEIDGSFLGEDMDVGNATIEHALTFGDGSTQAVAAHASDLLGHITPSNELRSFSYSAQSTEATDVFFRPNGLQMYFCGLAGEVNEYALTTAFDTDTATFTQVFDTSTEDADPQGLFFRDDGLLMFVLGNVTRDIQTYELSTAWDISTASFLRTTAGLGPPDMSGLWWRPDGRRLYLCRAGSSQVSEYNCQAQWDTRSLNFIHSFSTASQDTVPRGVAFSSDGQEMYVLGSASNAIYEYALTPAWDVLNAVFSASVLSTVDATAGMYVNDNATRLFYLNITVDTIVTREMALKFDGIIAGNSVEVVGKVAQGAYGDNTGLVMDFPFAEYGSAQHQYDRASGVITTTVAGTPQTSGTNGKFGSGVLCADGDSWSFVPPSNYPIGAADRTIEVWVNPSDLGVTSKTIFDYGVNTNDRKFAISINGDQAQLAFWGSDHNSGTTDFVVGEWALVHATYDGTTARMYVDNVEKVTVNTTLNTASSFAIISGYTVAGAESFRGNLAQLKMYDRVLSEDERKLSYMRHGGNAVIQTGSNIFRVTPEGIEANGNEVSTVGSEVIEVWSLADLPTPALGVITLPGGFYRFMTTVSFGTNQVRFENFDFVIFEQDDSFISSIEYDGTSPWFIGEGHLRLAGKGCTLKMTADNATMFDLNGGFGSDFSSLVADGDNSSMGEIRGQAADLTAIISARFFLTLTVVSGFRYGILLNSIQFLNLDSINTFLASDAIGPEYTLIGDYDFISFNAVEIQAPNAGSSFLKIDPTVENSAIITKCLLTGAGDFFEPGATGAITAFADASEPAEAVTSVTDNGGVARFNFTAPPTLYVGQKVVMSTFSNYTNGTFTITATGSGFYETGVPFNGADTGSFLTNSVTVTSAAHGLLDGATVLITDTIDYNLGSVIFNVAELGNSFEINALWSTAETSGTWDTGSLTEESKFVTARGNGVEPDSNPQPSISVGDNAETTTTTTSWGAIVFGTAGSAIIVGNSNQNFALVDELTGELRYEGVLPLSLKLTPSITKVKSGGSVEHQFRIFKTVGTPPIDPCVVKSEISTTTSSVSLNCSVFLNPGDQFRPEIRATTTGSVVTITDFSL